MTWEPGPGVVVLPDGRAVRGRGLRGPAPAGPAPTFAVHLTGLRPPATGGQQRWVRWPDFALPLSTPDALAALREAHERARDERVEVACGGGTGRTGTALAVLAVLSGLPAGGAVDWVRAHYRPGAVETAWQRRWVLRAAAALGGSP